jgi:hypothetical protein
MPVVTVKKKGSENKVTVVKKIKKYNEEPAFKKKAEESLAIIRKNGLPSKNR